VANKSDKAKQAQLNTQQQQLNTEATADRAAARTTPPLEQAQTDETLGYFDFLKDPAHDFSKLPSMAYSGMAEGGAAGAEEDRTALGSMRFGSAGADPNLQAVLKANISERRAQRKGENLQRAVERYDQMMRATAGDLEARDQARRMGLAGTTTSAGLNAMNQYASFQPRPSWGLQLLGSAIGGASKVGTAMATGGASAGTWGQFGQQLGWPTP
jgi:hypothetical protein